MPYSSRDKAYVPGAKPKADMSALDKELQELVAELLPTPEERQRQLVWPFTCPLTILNSNFARYGKRHGLPSRMQVHVPQNLYNP